MNEKFLKVPNWYLRFVRANKDFFFVLLWLYWNCDYYTQSGCFAFAELIGATKEKPTPARLARLKKALALLTQAGVLTLQGDPNILKLKPRQLVHVERFDYRYFLDLKKGFVLIPDSIIRKLLFKNFCISSENQRANVMNVFFEAMVKFDSKAKKTNFRYSTVAKSLCLPVEQVRECVDAMKRVIFQEAHWTGVSIYSDCASKRLVLDKEKKEEK